ncbi:MAG: type II secretion system minor pseudopilin GspH [Gammaproteobacteria bacterium]
MKDYQSRKVNGFTLLELLVALVLIGIILSFATLSLDGGEDRRIKEEANRFYHLIKLAQEESILNDREMSLEIDHKGYRFSILTDDGEQVIDDPVFRERVFAEFIKPEINIEESQFILKPDNQEDQTVIKIFILSSGELTPFQIQFPATNKTYQINGSMQGAVEMVVAEKDSQ